MKLGVRFPSGAQQRFACCVNAMSWYLYIVKCSDESLYTGITTDIDRRVRQHNNKLGAKSLRGKLPVNLVYKELYNSQIEAAVRERQIKSWHRKDKLRLINKGIQGLP